MLAAAPGGKVASDKYGDARSVELVPVSFRGHSLPTVVFKILLGDDAQGRQEPRNRETSSLSENPKSNGFDAGLPPVNEGRVCRAFS